MKRIFLLFLLLVVILPVVCIFLQPRLTDIDFLTLDLTVFSISLALMIFTAPYMMKFKDSLLNVDLALLQKAQSQIDYCKMTIENFKRLDEQDPQDSYKEIINKAEESQALLNEKIKEPFTYSNSITNIYKGIKDIIVWCFIAVVAHIVFNELLFTSDAFGNFVRNDLSYITESWNLPMIQLIVSSYIKLASLTLQLYFLFRTSEDAITTIQMFKAE